MLLELQIENFALVDRLTLSFDEGLSVLTGETGAGKSIILDSLGFLFGGSTRGKADPEKERRVTGRFVVAKGLLEDWGIDTDDGELIIMREQRSSGRSGSRLNGQLATLAQLRELKERLVDIHGQHQHHSLTRPQVHLELLDRWAGNQHLRRLDKYRQSYQQLSELERELNTLKKAERERVREIEWLSREVEEIEEANPVPGEEEELKAQVQRLAAAEQLRAGSARAAKLSGGDGGCADMLAEAISTLEPLTHHDSTLDEHLSRLREAEILLNDLGHELVSYRDRVQSDPRALDDLQGRLETLKLLRRKFGADLDEVLNYLEGARTRLQELQEADERITELEAKLEEHRAELRQQAETLSTSRRKAASQLESKVVQHLRELAMPATVFEVHFSALEEPGPEGMETAEFAMSANPGTPPQPLARTASGGELSRVMLGLISLFASLLETPTLVFDEIDVGLGGRAAEAVAAKLRQLSDHAQVLCVTHLAVVAAKGLHHYRVHKDVSGARTEISVRRLSEDDRRQEVARMLSGDASPELARLHADELLSKA